MEWYNHYVCVSITNSRSTKYKINSCPGSLFFFFKCQQFSYFESKISKRFRKIQKWGEFGRWLGTSFCWFSSQQFSSPAWMCSIGEASWRPQITSIVGNCFLKNEKHFFLLGFHGQSVILGFWWKRFFLARQQYQKEASFFSFVSRRGVVWGPLFVFPRLPPITSNLWTPILPLAFSPAS